MLDQPAEAVAFDDRKVPEPQPDELTEHAFHCIVRFTREHGVGHHGAHRRVAERHALLVEPVDDVALGDEPVDVHAVT